MSVRIGSRKSLWQAQYAEKDSILANAPSPATSSEYDSIVRGLLARNATSEGNDARHMIHDRIPATVAVMKQHVFPAIIAETTKAQNTFFFSGHIADRPPTWIPIEAKLENPHNA